MKLLNRYFSFNGVDLYGHGVDTPVFTGGVPLLLRGFDLDARGYWTMRFHSSEAYTDVHLHTLGCIGGCPFAEHLEQEAARNL